MTRKPILKSHPLPEMTLEEFYIAGQKVAPGVYRLVGSERDICLECEDTLPASLDGRVAVYVRQPLTWAEIRRIATEKPLKQTA